MTDAAVITPAQLEHLTSLLPAQTPLHAPITAAPAVVVPVPAIPTASVQLPPRRQVASMAPVNNEKHGYYSPTSTTQAPAAPPAYTASTSLGQAVAVYAYQSNDIGDCPFAPDDSITILEYVNTDWWRGRNERTKVEGIFPKTYVKMLDEKNKATSSSGIAPLDVAEGSVEGAKQPTKGQEMGKKFGKKLGNAAIFGAVSRDHPSRVITRSSNMLILWTGCTDRVQYCQWHFLV